MNAKPAAQPARRVLRLLAILQGHAADGLRLKQVAHALRVPACTALRDLEVMADEGFAERIPGREDCWRLTPKPVQISRAHDHEVQALRARADELDQRYSRLPN